VGVPPLVGVAVNVTLLPEQMAPEGDAAILTLAGRLEFTAMVMALEVAVLGLAQVAFEVRTHVTICPLVNDDVVNVEELVPEFVPLTFHWYAGEVPPFVCVAVNIDVEPEHNGLLPDVIAIEIIGSSPVFIVIFVPLSLPVVVGFDPFILILYAVPCAIPAGILAVMVPPPVPKEVPILVGEIKLPVEFESSAVKKFPELNVPVIVYGILILAPEQSGLPVIAAVAIVVPIL
jgi:hypothetical protein